MSEALSSLLVEQSNAFERIRRVLVNFKKLPKVQVTLPKAKARLADLKEYWEKAQLLHNRICIAAKAEERAILPYFVNSDFDKVEDAYDEASDHLHEAINKFVRVETPPCHNSTEVSIREPLHSQSLQLPRIPLPKFSGAYTEWENFRNTFESLVANQDSLTNTQKMHYLKSSVSGDAARLIENLRISDTNYEPAWKILTSEYDDVETIVYAHLSSFYELPVMKTETVVELRRLRDAVSAAVQALRNLDRPVDHWDDILVFIVIQKFCQRTKNEWNLRRGLSSELPTYKELHDFLTQRIRGLTDPSDRNASKSSQPNKAKSSVHNVTVIKCVLCSGNHVIYRCKDFLSKSVDERNSFVRTNKLCFNCLRAGHGTQACRGKILCRHCSRKHHTLLHGYNCEALAEPVAHTKASAPASAAQTQNSDSAAVGSAAVAQVQTVQAHVPSAPNVLLATAWVDLHTKEGRKCKVRALLDQGSTFSFISESLCQTLRTKRHQADLQIHCFGEKYSGIAKSRVTVSLSPCAANTPLFPLTAYVYQRITSYAASRVRPIDTWSHLRDLALADPDPSSRHPIHLLIGADLYGSLLLGDLRKGPLGTPTAQKTALGWVLSGPTTAADSSNGSASVSHCDASLDTNLLLQRFWQDEELPQRPSLTEEEEKCEAHFETTHTRLPEGRYVVRLPFKQGNPPKIGESLPIASSLYERTERRLKNRPDIRAQYDDFLREYESLGHMRIVKENQETTINAVYIPHHAVLRESSSTTKLRVVFNASCKTRDGTSLNDYLMIGPKLQADPAAIILRWRQWCYVYMADIAKMFRQILVDPADTDFQRILWRPSDDSPVKSFRLLTVTYGLASAPYLALRVLQQLAKDDGHAFPKAVSILENSLYVDDMLFGNDDVCGLREARNQLIELLKRGGFQLRKWTANSPELLTDIPTAHQESIDHFLAKDDTLKVLGLSWLSKKDSFYFVISPTPQKSPTKRSILSIVAKLYDPLGWAAPTIITAKILLQELWLLKGDWDDPIPPELTQKWLAYYSDLPNLSSARIPRWTGRSKDNIGIEIHGFADASNRAYAAVVYMRVLHEFDRVQVSLLAAKTKVAPIKTVSIPRLELNAVVLLCRLMNWIITSLSLLHTPLYGWTDSTIALAWLRQHPSKWPTYVANRVSEVQTTLPTIRWHHVASKQNPADCASRGITASELVAHDLWWTGPPWLWKPSTVWPLREFAPQLDDLAAKQMSAEVRRATVHHTEADSEWSLPQDYSSWTKLVRVTAYVRRFVEVLKRKRLSLALFDSPTLTVPELQDASSFWFRRVQQSHFAAEWHALKNGASVPSSSALRALNPLIGDDELIRLGGRLEHAALGYGEQHPIILPRHRIADLLIDQTHKAMLHGGTQLTLRTLRQRYWILGARNMTKTRIRQCVTCARYAAVSPTQIMGNLPPQRVTRSSPFTNTGVDYAGPFFITPHVGRGLKTTKNYVALFVCLATRAIHLESVDDYSTDGFLAALRRFASRRGMPAHMFSDNGTNFQGADRELSKSFSLLQSDPTLKDVLANDGVTWHFIPASAPHFGGLWEAGVGSFKRHFRRIVGSRTLSRAEFATLLCTIEACLNSRPIAPLNDDPSDFACLTPGHFLIGRPIVSVPEQSVLDIESNRLSRWQLVRSMQEQIWRSWTKDYLHSLQIRGKWTKPQREIEINELVLLKNSLLPPSKWELARVEETHPGADGHVRVVTLRTASSTYKRPIAQICRLPVPFERPTIV